MKNVIAFLLAMVMALSLCACAGQPASTPAVEANAEESAPAADSDAVAAEEPAAAAADIQHVVFQLGHVDPEDEQGNIHYYALQFAKLCAEKSGGAIEIQIMPNSQLGGERDLMEGMQIGTIDMAIITNLAVSNFWPECMVYDLPYLFEDVDAGIRMLDSDIDKEISQNMYDNIGIKVLSKGDSGFRHTANNIRPIKSTADLKGIKLRVPETTMYMETFKALGASPTPMAWGEVFTGLQQGTIDGCELPTAMMVSNRIYEVCKYYSATSHFFSPVQLLMSKAAWDGLNADTQALMQECADEAAVLQRDFQKVNEERLLSILEENGMECNLDVNIPEFQQAAASVYDLFRDDIGSDLLDRAVAFAKGN